MKRLIKQILRSPCFESDPPVLVDIGASGGLPKEWRLLAPFSVGVAFDADTRDFSADDPVRRHWKQLHRLNSLVTDSPADHVRFHLTASPHCSSTLAPDSKALRPWAIDRLFDVVKVVDLPSTNLQTALARADVSRIDWLKCDTQGTDLRLFRSLAPAIQDTVLAASFEPGIIDAYQGEDKLHTLMAYMDERPFWVSAMEVKGSQRLGDVPRDSLPPAHRRIPRAFYRTSPGWCEIAYLNTCEATDITKRNLLLAIVFALIQDQLGFALHLSQRGQARFGDPLFDAIGVTVRRHLRLGYLRLCAELARSMWRRIS